MVQTITFRPTKAVWDYLKRLDNKSKEINDIIEQSIGMPLPSIPLKFPSEFPPKINTTNIKSQIDKSISALKTQSENAQPPKDVRFEISDDFKNATDKVESPMQKVLSEITQKVVNSDNFYDEENPAPPAKDKKYYKDLEMYKEIKKKHGCVDKYGERLDTSDALKYAGLEDFTPLD